MHAADKPDNQHGRKKPVVLALIAIAAASTALARWLKPADGPPTAMDFVCVTTGEIVRLTVDEAGMIPARNRTTGTRTLLPCVCEPDGRYRVPDRYRPLLENRLQEANQRVTADGYVTPPAS